MDLSPGGAGMSEPIPEWRDEGDGEIVVTASAYDRIPVGYTAPEGSHEAGVLFALAERGYLTIRRSG